MSRADARGHRELYYSTIPNKRCIEEPAPGPMMMPENYEEVEVQVEHVELHSFADRDNPLISVLVSVPAVLL
jgi:hypothetical protein